MRVSACVLLLLCSITAQAIDFGSIAVYTPKPAYPQRLGDKGVSGKVDVTYAIQADGRVTEINILESTHPRFDVEVIRTLETWRFKPWSITPNRPSEIKEKVSIVFSLDRESKALVEINDELHYWRCSDVNREVEGSESEFPEKPLSNALFFWTTSAHISEALIKAKVSDAERETLIDKLKAALPDIAQRCKESPDSYYQDYLPDEIKKYVLSTKVNTAGFQLIPHYVPAIPYPDELQKAGTEGEVLASYFVQANGTVTKVKVLASTHPLLAESAEKTIPTWRFRPWVPDNDKRSEIEVHAPFRFHIGGEKSAPPDSNLILAKIKCSEVNKAFTEMNKKWRDYPLAKMRIFWHTEQYLNAPFMTANASAAEIEAMTNDFKSGLVGILDTDVSLLETNHPEYAESVLKAVATWRYKPWPLDGNPLTTVLISTFTRTSDPGLNETHREILRNMRCRHLTKEVARFQETSPEEPLIEMTTARRTLKMLRISPLELPYQQSLELAVLFGALPLQLVAEPIGALLLQLVAGRFGALPLQLVAEPVGAPLLRLVLEQVDALFAVPIRWQQLRLLPEPEPEL